MGSFQAAGRLYQRKSEDFKSVFDCSSIFSALGRLICRMRADLNLLLEVLRSEFKIINKSAEIATFSG
ncbi:hypothetical protein Pfo_026111 [Paulownia fortunei]|nr:hypothetical protein Pfo_026111 [Paulownia fortunei]